MLRILKFLVTGYWHTHVWEDAGKVHASYTLNDQGEQISELPVSRRQPVKCKICGTRRSFVL